MISYAFGRRRRTGTPEVVASPGLDRILCHERGQSVYLVELAQPPTSEFAMGRKANFTPSGYRGRTYRHLNIHTVGPAPGFYSSVSHFVFLSLSIRG